MHCPVYFSLLDVMLFLVFGRVAYRIDYCFVVVLLKFAIVAYLPVVVVFVVVSVGW